MHASSGSGNDASSFPRQTSGGSSTPSTISATDVLQERRRRTQAKHTTKNLQEGSPEPESPMSPEMMRSSFNLGIIKCETQLEHLGKQVDDLRRAQETRFERLSEDMRTLLTYLKYGGRPSPRSNGQQLCDSLNLDSTAALIPPSSSVELMNKPGNQRPKLVRRPSVLQPDSYPKNGSMSPDNSTALQRPDPDAKIDPPSELFPDTTKDVLKDSVRFSSSEAEKYASPPEPPETNGEGCQHHLDDHKDGGEPMELTEAPESGHRVFRRAVGSLVLEALNLGGGSAAGKGGDSIYIKSSNRVRSRLQKTIWSFLEDPELVRGGKTFEHMFAVFIMVSFFLNISQLVPDLPMNSMGVELCEVVLDCLFLVEVLVRLWSSPNRVRFFGRSYNNLDIVAGVLPLVLRMAQGSLVLSAASEESMGQTMKLCVCMVPILRLLKLLRHFATFHLLIMAFTDALQALPVLLYMLGVLVIFFAALLYVFEDASSIESFPQAVWFILVTVSTVGYGDITPSNMAGHLIVSMLIIISALYMAIPIGIVGKAFGNVWDNRKQLLLLHRLRVRFITAGYNVDDIPAMFCNFDVNADGQLSKSEFRDMLRQMEIELSTGVAADIFSAFDEDGSGAVDDVEFVKALFPKTAAALYDEPGEDEDEEDESSEEGKNGHVRELTHDEVDLQSDKGTVTQMM